jgi:hypothetical protein
MPATRANATRTHPRRATETRQTRTVRADRPLVTIASPAVAPISSSNRGAVMRDGAVSRAESRTRRAQPARVSRCRSSAVGPTALRPRARATPSPRRPAAPKAPRACGSPLRRTPAGPTLDSMGAPTKPARVEDNPSHPWRGPRSQRKLSSTNPGGAFAGLTGRMPAQSPGNLLERASRLCECFGAV